MIPIPYPVNQGAAGVLRTAHAVGKTVGLSRRLWPYGYRGSCNAEVGFAASGIVAGGLGLPILPRLPAVGDRFRRQVPAVVFPAQGAEPPVVFGLVRVRISRSHLPADLACFGAGVRHFPASACLAR
jgi:hypothetical protein